MVAFVLNGEVSVCGPCKTDLLNKVWSTKATSRVRLQQISKHAWLRNCLHCTHQAVLFCEVFKNQLGMVSVSGICKISVQLQIWISNALAKYAPWDIILQKQYKHCSSCQNGNTDSKSRQACMTAAKFCFLHQ